MEHSIVLATEADTEEILALYRAQLGRPCCPWDEEYPSRETVDWDLSRDALFVWKQDGKILGAVSLEEDEEADSLSCWDPSLAPAGELARLAVLPEHQGKGLGGALLGFGMEELKRRGFLGIRMLVNRSNDKAIGCYDRFAFHVAGQCRMYGQNFLCYEKKL